MISFRHLRSRAQQAFWLLPAACNVAAIILSLLLPSLDDPLDSERLFGVAPSQHGASCHRSPQR